MGQETSERPDFEAYAERIVNKYQVPGFALGLAQDGAPTYEKGFGFRDREQQLPLSSETVFGIGSITKSVTAIAILQLQEKGKLSVSDLVITYLPEFELPEDEYTKQTTIHHLLTHSSGLPPLPTLFGSLKRSMMNDPVFDVEEGQKSQLDALETIDTYSDLLSAIKKNAFTPLGEPGEEFSYSNEGFALLGVIIERISNQTYEEYVEQNILQPVGMGHSAFSYDELNGHDDVAVLYDMRTKEDGEVVFRSDNPWDAPAMRSAGFLKSTTSDMLRYMEIFRNKGTIGQEQILSPESVEAMVTPYIPCDYGSYYGYGLMIVPDFFGFKLIQHGGDVKGVAAQMNILPEFGLTGIALANIAGAPSARLLNAVCQDFMDIPVDASHLNVEAILLDPSILREYEGTFVSGEGGQIEFFAENDALHFRSPELPEGVLVPVGKDLFLFHMREMDFIIRFVRNENNAIQRVAFGFRQIPKGSSTVTEAGV